MLFCISLASALYQLEDSVDEILKLVVGNLLVKTYLDDSLTMRAASAVVGLRAHSTILRRSTV